MTSEQKPKDEDKSGEYQRFSTALNKILKVSHSDIQAKLEESKKAKASKLQPSSRASRAKG